MSLKTLACTIPLLSIVSTSCGSGTGSTPADGGECKIAPKPLSPCAFDQQSCTGPTVCRSCNDGLGLWALEPVWGCVCASMAIDGRVGLYWQCPSVPVCTLGPGTFTDSQCTQPAVPDGGIVDAGACSWPANFTSSGDASSAGCWAKPSFYVCEVPNGGSVNGQDGTIRGPDGQIVTGTCKDSCSASEYALTCTGEMMFPASIPSPDSSLGCTVIPGPTPSNVLSYCCPCK